MEVREWVLLAVLGGAPLVALLVYLARVSTRDAAERERERNLASHRASAPSAGAATARPPLPGPTPTHVSSAPAAGAPPLPSPLTTHTRVRGGTLTTSVSVMVNGRPVDLPSPGPHGGMSFSVQVSDGQVQVFAGPTHEGGSANRSFGVSDAAPGKAGGRAKREQGPKRSRSAPTPFDAWKLVPGAGPRQARSRSPRAAALFDAMEAQLEELAADAEGSPGAEASFDAAAPPGLDVPSPADAGGGGGYHHHDEPDER